MASMASTPDNTTDDISSQIDVNLLESNTMKVTRPDTIQKFKPKTNLPAMPNSVRAIRTGSVSRAGQHRWPQATMVVMGGNERQVYNTEVLTVSTNSKKLQETSNKKRSNDEAETRITLPDIATNGRTYHTEGDADIPNRFKAKSPSKLSQLPVFSKTLLDQPKQQQSQKENLKLIKSIKFWRGTTPNTQVKEKQETEDKKTLKENSEKKEATESENISKNDSILQTWTEQLNIFEESSKNKYFSWQMALRNRLLKHEKMYYQEAVSRINKYRQQLRTKPAFGVSRDIPGNMDQHLWKSLLQQHRDKKTDDASSNKPTGVSMSPTQEWKPYVAHERGKGQRKALIFGNASIPSEIKKKNLKTDDVSKPSTSSNKRLKYHPSADMAKSKYPVHGEALLKDEPKKSKTTLPGLTSPNPTKEQDEDNGEKKDASDTDNEEEKTSTRALLVDLKNQLMSKTEQQTVENKNETVNPTNADNNRAQTGLGLKLRLLLQNSAHAQQNQNENSSESSRKTVTARKSRSRLHSQQGSYRPISRPRTIGDGSFPKIHNIVTTSLWKRHGITKNTEPRNAGIKHRLTLAGVANRETFSSSVIGIAQKHITKRSKQSDTKTNPEQITIQDETNPRKGKKDSPVSTMVSNSAANFKNNKHEYIASNEQTETSAKSKKKKNPAYRLYTPATIQQHQFSSTASLSRIQEKENPQYKSLKLVTALTEKQKSPPLTPLEQFRVRQHTLKGKTKAKTGGKHKVLRIAVVEPPLTAKERFERQQESERSRKRLTFNPTHAALSNFSTAILNSELDLRAPSSSPVDMFFEQYHHLHGDQDPPDYWGLQKRVESHNNLKMVDGIHETSYKSQQHINQMDDLMPPRPPVQIDGFRVNTMYGNSGIKPSTAPKLKDLVDLQKLYHVMKKHGEAYTNGSAYFYSPTPNTGLEAMPKAQLAKVQVNRKNLNKMPFYYYPYQGDTNMQAVNEHEGAPLYVVTGANSMMINKNLHNMQQTKKSVSYLPQVEGHIMDERAASVPFRHVLNLSENQLPHWEAAKPGLARDIAVESKNALTVIMPKTPGITLPSTLPIAQLEQIQEHILQ